ncbi:MAG: hypothetical protein ABSG82_01795, partial [Sedimentisphaerales bacterium]
IRFRQSAGGNRPAYRRTRTIIAAISHDSPWSSGGQTDNQNRSNFGKFPKGRKMKKCAMLLNDRR